DPQGESLRPGAELRRGTHDSHRDRPVRDTGWSSPPRALPAPEGTGRFKGRSDVQRYRKVILTVTLNAAIDRTVAVPNFRLGRRHRAVESRTVAGGKGINVARALNLLGRPVIATGFVGGPSGTRVLEELHEESVLTDFIEIAAETRINLAVIDPTSGEQTEI